MHPLKKRFLLLSLHQPGAGHHRHCTAHSATVPFYLLTAFCFANSSERLHTWFTHTTVYKSTSQLFPPPRHDPQGQGDPHRHGNSIMLPGFILMDKVPVGRAIMAIVWAGHIVYFGFKVQTITQQEADDAMAQALEE